MVMALLHRIGEYFRTLFFLQGLPAPQHGAQNAAPAATVSGTGALPPG